MGKPRGSARSCTAPAPRQAPAAVETAVVFRNSLREIRDIRPPKRAFCDCLSVRCEARNFVTRECGAPPALRWRLRVGLTSDASPVLFGEAARKFLHKFRLRSGGLQACITQLFCAPPIRLKNRATSRTFDLADLGSSPSKLGVNNAGPLRREAGARNSFFLQTVSSCPPVNRSF